MVAAYQKGNAARGELVGRLLLRSRLEVFGVDLVVGAVGFDGSQSLIDFFQQFSVAFFHNNTELLRRKKLESSTILSCSAPLLAT